VSSTFRSDRRLGHTLRGEVTREYDHAALLGWLLEACVREAADAAHPP
jgi:hypothetical protein